MYPAEVKVVLNLPLDKQVSKWWFTINQQLPARGGGGRRWSFRLDLTICCIQVPVSNQIYTQGMHAVVCKKASGTPAR